MKTFHWLTMMIVMTLFIACESKENDPGGTSTTPTIKNTVTGSIEKGPFLSGTKVTLYELDENLNPTGKNIFKTETNNENGNFSFSEKMELSSQYVELEIDGFYFNEITGEPSESRIMLNAIADISGKDQVNINILTHLELKRVKKLVAGGLSFADAKKQARQELLNVFSISKEIPSPDNISLTDGDDQASILLAVSAVLLDNKKEAKFTEFISNLSNDFADKGTVTNENLKSEIMRGQREVNGAGVMENLKSYYQGNGKEVSIINIHQYIDRNNDGVLDEKDDSLVIIPPSIIEPENILTNEENFIKYLTYCESLLSDYFKKITVIDALRCKQISLPSFIFNADNPTINDAWTSAYKTLRHLNLLITDGSKKNLGFEAPYIATAKAMRAMIYLDMTQHWGDVPLVTSVIGVDNVENYYIPRDKKEQIYRQLLSDLESAIPYLPTNTDLTQQFLSVGLARTLMGVIHLENKDYQQGMNQFEQIIQSGRYALVSDTSIYEPVNPETLYSLPLYKLTTGYYTFESLLKKGNCHPLYRYTGLLLDYATACVKTGNTSKALASINQIRRNKGLSDLAPSVNDDALLQEIASLWKSIIATDYGYFALLKRLNLATELLGIESEHQLYPIPRRELELNPNIKQNPGY